MQWTDHGILLKKQKFGETSRILTFFTPQRGKHVGLYRGSASNLLHMGEHFQVLWKSRLSEHLGTWSNIECLTSSPFVHILNSAGKLYALSSALFLTEKFLAERDPHPKLYEDLCFFIETLKKEEDSWILVYIFYEVSLLREIGFGLDFSKCAVTGKQEDLAFVSPRTGHAVTLQGGAGYLDRLLPLPPFLKELSFFQIPKDLPSSQSLQDAFFLTQHFLEKCLESYASSSYFKSSLPSYRSLLVTWVENFRKPSL